MPTIAYDDLEAALQWVSSSAPFENAAYVSKTTGKVFCSSSGGDIEDELPDDYDNAALYWTVPHKNDLDLGSRLAHRFTDEHLPEHRREVHDIFRHRGAYGKFKALLQRLRILDAWFELERAETAPALLAWAKEAGKSVELRRKELSGRDDGRQIVRVDGLLAALHSNEGIFDSHEAFMPSAPPVVGEVDGKRLANTSWPQRRLSVVALRLPVSSGAAAVGRCRWHAESAAARTRP